MYAEDSFFTLNRWGQVGLIALSVLLFLILFWFVLSLTKRRPPFTRIAIAFLVFWLFVWLSPQIYYSYYRVIIDGLPQQWVIGWPPFGDAARYLTFTGPATLSAHGQGMMGWALLACALLHRRNPVT